MPKKEALLTLLKEYLEKDEIIEDSIYGLFVCYRQGKWLENREGILILTSKRVLFFSISLSERGYLQEIPYGKITHIFYKRGLLANNGLEIILGRDREINRDSHQLLQKGLEITLEPERAAMTGKFSEAFAKKLSEKVGLELRIIDRRRQERNLVLVILVVVASIAFFRIYNAVVSPRRKKVSSQLFCENGQGKIRTKNKDEEQLSKINGQKLCVEQEECFNKSFDMAERRYGTVVASPNFDAFNDYRMTLYAECESKLFKKYGLTRKEGYKIYEESGCAVIPMPEKYYREYYK